MSRSTYVVKPIAYTQHEHIAQVILRMKKTNTQLLKGIFDGAKCTQKSQETPQPSDRKFLPESRKK